MSAPTYDLLGVGIGPFNLSLAALSDGVTGLRATFVERRPTFSWHPGLLLDGAELQVSFLADLVTLVDPTSRWSFLAYLHAHERLLPFYLRERWRPSRREYDDYCRWVATSLPNCRFGTEVKDVAWDGAGEVFVVRVVDHDGVERRLHARNVVGGVGTVPSVPAPFESLLGKEVFHAATYLDNRPALAGAGDVTVVGSGQSGAEVFLDLLQAQSHEGWGLRWLTRSPAFAPMEQSPLGLEHFTPDYTAYFRGLRPGVRDRLLRDQWQLYKAISPATIAAIYDVLYERAVSGERLPVVLTPNVEVTSAELDGGPVRLRCREALQDEEVEVVTDRVVLATGYGPRRPPFDGLDELVRRDATGRIDVDEHYRLVLDPAVSGGVFVQNAEHHRNGVGTPDLGLGAHRAAAILNAATGRSIHRLDAPAAFTTFGVR